MTRLALALTATAVLATPAAAQMNPAAIGGGLVMPSAINAQAKNAARHHRGSTAAASEQSDAEICASLPEYRRTLGPRNAKVVQLTSLCRQAGLGG